MSASALSFVTQVPLLDLRPPQRPSILVPDPPPVESSPIREDVQRLRASLQGTAAANLMNATELLRALERTRRDELIPTTLEPFDQLLGGGLPRGKMVELTGRRSVGRFSIVMAALAAATSVGEAAVLIDLGDHLDPRCLQDNGADLRRILWVRPKTMKQAVMAAEMLAPTGFQLIALDAGRYPVKGRRVPDAAWVRLARAAEAHGTALLVSTPYAITGTASEAVVLAHRSRTKWHGRGKSPRLFLGATTELRLEKHRHMKAGKTATITFTVPDASPLTAHPSPLAEAPPSALRPPLSTALAS